MTALPLGRGGLVSVQYMGFYSLFSDRGADGKEGRRILCVTYFPQTLSFEGKGKSLLPPRLFKQRETVHVRLRPPVFIDQLKPFQISGGENSLTEDLRLRPLANQWLAAGHGIAASPWLPQNPFALHPAIPTSNAAFDPNHHPGVPIPGGFKLAQDSLTGQLLIIPSGGGFQTRDGAVVALFDGTGEVGEVASGGGGCGSADGS